MRVDFIERQWANVLRLIRIGGLFPTKSTRRKWGDYKRGLCGNSIAHYSFSTPTAFNINQWVKPSFGSAIDAGIGEWDQKNPCTVPLLFAVPLLFGSDPQTCGCGVASLAMLPHCATWLTEVQGTAVAAKVSGAASSRGPATS